MSKKESIRKKESKEERTGGKKLSKPHKQRKSTHESQRTFRRRSSQPISLA